MPQIRKLSAAWVFQPVHSRSAFGDLVVVSFLVMQALDGVLTYIGVSAMGPGVEGNPFIASLISRFGLAAGLGGAKLFAGSLGVLLHLRGVHYLVALLTGFYLLGAIVPWMTILAQ